MAPPFSFQRVLYSPKSYLFISGLLHFPSTMSPTLQSFWHRLTKIISMLLNKQDDQVIYGKGSDNVELFEHKQYEIYNKYLLATNAVTQLTHKFTEILQRELAAYCDRMNVPSQDNKDLEWHSIPMVSFLKEHIFTASTTATYGSKIFEFVPRLADKYWHFDTGLLARLYGLPRYFYPDAYAGIEEYHAGMIKWIEAGNAHHNGLPPLDMQWEEWAGSAVVRARRHMYTELGMSVAGMASFDMGFMFGLSSNAIPCTNWLLCHLLSPSNSSLLAQIQTEVDAARLPGGKIDMPTLLAAPYLTSAFNETLRHYVDVLVTRELKADMVIENHFLPAGDVVMAPIFLAHHDGQEWNAQPSPYGAKGGVMPPENVWFGKRFLKIDEKTGKAALSTREAAGKFIPWGGGAQICPGRVFAKQEVFAAVATFLGRFEVRFEEFLESTGKDGKMGKGLGREEESGFPVVKKQYSGNGVVAIEGDLRIGVRLRD
jgi:hypothetical protein